jgi:hypothetical protein
LEISFRPGPVPEQLPLALLGKLRRAGPPLGEYVKGRFYYGIKTGLNDAFVVDRSTRDRLIVEHKSSAELLKPFLRGRDVKRWRLVSEDKWLIFVPWHFPLHEDSAIQGPSEKAEAEFKKRYPAVYRHLSTFKEPLAARNRAETGVRYEWYALQRWGADYWREFEHSKVLYPDIYEHQSFVWEDSGFYPANTCYFIPTSEKWLTGLMNSLTIEWFYGFISNRIRGGYLRSFSDYMQQIPIPKATITIKELVESNVTKIQEIKKKDPGAFVGELEAEIDGLVAHLYGLTEEEFQAILDDLSLPDPARVAALNAYRETKRSFAK